MRHPKRFDLNIYLGGIFPEWLPLARKNISMPNVEDIPGHSHKYLRFIDHIVAKTRLTERVFRQMGFNTEYTGFMSRDIFDPEVPRDRIRFFHACSSQYKGTKRLLELWTRHPEWPELVATINYNPTIPEQLAPNIHAIRRPMTQAEVVQIRNTRTFHLCPSEVEGFGHYILEAMGCRAVVLTPNAAPMNELIQPARGILLDILDDRPPMGFSHRCFFKPESLEQQVEHAMKLDQAAIDQIGANARAFFLENCRAFLERFADVIRSIAKSKTKRGPLSLPSAY